MVSKGLSHIGTTLDPEYIGPSLIAVHNHSNENITLTPEVDTFATLVFQYVKNKASHKHGNNPGRPDVLNSFKLSELEKKWLEEDFRQIPEKLKAKMEADSKDFQEILKKRKAPKVRIRPGVVYIFLLIIFIISLFSYVILDSKKTSFSNQHWYDQLRNVLLVVTTIVPSIFLNQWLSDSSKSQ